MKPSFVTWQLRRLHAELDAIDKQRGADPGPAVLTAPTDRGAAAPDGAAARAVLERLLRSLPQRLGFRDASAFAEAFARANELGNAHDRRRRRLSPAQVRELERRVLNNERPLAIARAIGCAEQTVLNRATQLRKRLAITAESDASGI